MSIVPLLFNLLDDEPSTFGLGYHPNDLLHPRSSLNSIHWPSAYQTLATQPRRHNRNRDQRLAVNSHVGKNGFQVSLDVQHFSPNEITVKTLDNNTVVVEGKHEEKEDEHGHIFRHFVRRYVLPKEYDMKDVVSTLSSDGVLTVKASPPTKSIESSERVVQIQQTGPAHLSVKDNSDAKKDEDKMTE